MQQNQNEIFKDIIGYEGLYKISNLGVVISLERIKYKNQIAPFKIKAINDNGNGYKIVNLWKNNKGRTFYVHRLVCESFIGQIPKDMQVNHINGIKEDNRLSNLEIITVSENAIHARKLGLVKPQFGKINSNNKSGYSNISTKQIKSGSCFVVCIRTENKRFEKRFKDLYEAIVIHNQYMRSIGKSHLIHKIKI